MDALIDRLFVKGADPWIIRHGDYYYYVHSAHQGIALRRARTLADLRTGEQKKIWTAPEKGANSKEIWAPEIHVVDGRWYVYYAADDGDNANHRMFVLECPDADPFTGTFQDRGQIKFDPDRWAIDGTFLQHAGKLYFCWSGWQGDKNVSQELYLAPMRDPLVPAGPGVMISKPELPWELHGKINEGPEFLVHGGKIHVIYSASGSWTDHYCLGRLTANADANLLDPASWKKHPDAVFAHASGIISPGHCSFVNVSEDGDQPWIVYHCAKHFGAGWDRYVRAQRFKWNADDTPDFGTPAGPIGREH